MFRGLIVLLAMISAALAAAYIKPLEEKPEEFKDESGCYIAEINGVIPVGESRASKSKCMSYNCYEDNVQVFTCEVVALKQSCKLVADKSKAYPDCCGRELCPATQDTEWA